MNHTAYESLGTCDEGHASTFPRGQTNHMTPTGTWQRFAPPPSAVDIQKILRKHTFRMAQNGEPYLIRKSGEPTYHQEVLETLRGKGACDLTRDFDDTLRFGPASQ